MGPSTVPCGIPLKDVPPQCSAHPSSRMYMHTSLYNDVWAFMNAQYVPIPLKPKRVMREIG